MSLDESGWEKKSPWNTSPELWEKLRPLAKQMRKAPTPAENFLWQRLRGKRFAEHKFRRQHTFDRFIVDFYCHEAQLVIEVDGLIHDYTQEQDALRTEFLESQGLRVLRFSNADVMTKIQGVLERIGETLEEMKLSEADEGDPTR